jgi:hypothetical protein
VKIPLIFRALVENNFYGLRKTMRFGFIYKADPPVHIRICVGECKAIGGRKGKQGGDPNFLPAPYRVALKPFGLYTDCWLTPDPCCFFDVKNLLIAQLCLSFS